MISEAARTILGEAHSAALAEATVLMCAVPAASSFGSIGGWRLRLPHVEASVLARSLDAAEYSKRCIGSHAFTQDQGERKGFMRRRVCVSAGTSYGRRNGL